MIELILKPALHRFNTCREFAGEFKLGKGDLVLTNSYIFNPYFEGLVPDADVIFQEDFGTGEPTDVMVDAILAEAAKLVCRRIIAVGGGTIIDIAKVLAVAVHEDVDVLYDMAPDLKKKRELIIIPTTCGTGSEVTNISILNRTRRGGKQGLVSESMYADCAVLIPELLNGLPYGIFATSSLDALIHGVESALSPKCTPYTRLFSYQAAELIIKGYQRIAAEGKETRNSLMEDFLIASNFAGIAFGTAGCATVHAMSYPLGSKYHVAHGESNYALFTGVLKNYMELKSDGEIGLLNLFLADMLVCPVSRVYDELEALLDKILTRKPLRDYGATQEDLKEFAQSVMANQKRLMNNSFVPLDEGQILKIYTELY